MMNKNSEQWKVYMNVPEVSDYMRISARKVRELIACRELKIIRIGRRVIVRRVDIDNFMDHLAS